MRLPPDVGKAGLKAPSEIASREEIHEACGQHIAPTKCEVHRPISIGLTRASYYGVFQHEELEILQRVFDQVCRDRRYRPESEQAEAIAATIIALFQAGVLTGHELVAELDRGKDLGRIERERSDPMESKWLDRFDRRSI